MMAKAGNAGLVLTVGHSNRTLADFLALLEAHAVQQIADVRKLPGSRAYPHFNAEELAASLKSIGIEYQHLPGLGGRRKGSADSPNGAWKNASFRAFADYMQTEEFAQALAPVQQQSAKTRIALMCSEAVPWRCHRSLIADALVVRGHPVEHIMTPTKRDVHVLRDWARVSGGIITYPPETTQGTLFDA